MQSFLAVNGRKLVATYNVFYIVFKSRGDRDRINTNVMKDLRLATMMMPGAMPFDTKRMIFGGFETLVSVSYRRILQ